MFTLWEVFVDLLYYTMEGEYLLLPKRKQQPNITHFLKVLHFESSLIISLIVYLLGSSL